MALAGRVEVRLTNEGGCVEVGDWLTSSSTPGAAMLWSEPDSNDVETVRQLLEWTKELERRKDTRLGRALETSCEPQDRILMLIR